jgi:hypothetical protein
MRAALQTAPASADMAPLFRLCWSWSEQAELILAHALPERPEALRQYLSFLLGAARLEAAQAVAARILERATAEDVPLLLACCDRLLEARQTATAAHLWNAMIGRGLIGYQALRPADGLVLTNGDFRLPPRSQGFDWRLPPVEGASVSRDIRAAALHVTFSGKQPEQCELLWQYLPLLAATSYRFSFQYQTAGIAPATGLRWEIQDLTGATAPLAASTSLAAENWTAEELTFTTPAKLAATRLVLTYRRTPGTTRVSGWIALRRLELRRAEQAG